MVIDIDAHGDDVPARDRILPGIPVPDHVDLAGLATGFHTLAVLAAMHNEPSPADDNATLRVRTPSGGLHVWYRTQPGRRMLSSTGSGIMRALAWQVDVRGLGGYIVTPGTTTAAGTYVVEGTTTLPRIIPAWLAAELDRTGHRETPVTARQDATVLPRAAHAVARARATLPTGAPGSGAERAIGAVLAEVLACASTAEGAGFSEKLNRASYILGGMTAAGRLTADDARQRLIDAAEFARPGQGRRAEGIIRSGMAAGQRRPLHQGGPA